MYRLRLFFSHIFFFLNGLCTLHIRASLTYYEAFMLFIGFADTKYMFARA